jgi:hypothetical protein
MGVKMGVCGRGDQRHEVKSLKDDNPIVDGVSKDRGHSGRSGRRDLDGVEQQDLAGPYAGTIGVKPADQRRRDGRIARKLIRERVSSRGARSLVWQSPR